MRQKSKKKPTAKAAKRAKPVAPPARGRGRPAKPSADVRGWTLQLPNRLKEPCKRVALVTGESVPSVVARLVAAGLAGEGKG